MKYSDNMLKMANDHAQMKDWHESMAKASADSLQDHIKAAAWHDSQANLIKAMMNEVPLDPEKKVTSVPTAGGATPAPAGRENPSREVPLDPQTVKKSDLIDLLKKHTEEHGEFDVDIETIASFLINE